MTTEELIKENEFLIRKIAKNFYNVSMEDLMQAGAIGILKAYKNYRKDGEVKFSTYAYEYIYGEMYDFVNKDKKMKVSKEMLRLARQVEITRNALCQKYMRDISSEEIAKFLGLSIHQVNDILLLSKEMISLDEKSEASRDLYETVPVKQSISLDEKILLQDSINTLSKEEQDIIKYRYFKDYTQSEIARKMGMTQVMVSRYESKSLKKMRKYLSV